MKLKAEVVQAKYRESKGKGSARSLRRDGNIPVVIYGQKKENVDLAVNEYDISIRAKKPGFMAKIFKFETGKSSYFAIPHEVQYHPVTDKIEHIDFLHVIEGVEVKVHVKLHYINQDKSIGIKRGGVLNIVCRTVELHCDPASIPASLEIDVVDLDIGNSLHINNINLPEGSRYAGSDNLTLVTIVGRSEETEAAVTAAAPVAAAAPAAAKAPAAKK